MREDQLVNGMILKVSLDLRSASSKTQFCVYFWTVVKPLVRIGREALVPEKCAFRRLPGPGARSRSSTRVVSVWFGLPNMNGIQPDSLERWSVQVERNMSKGVLVLRNT